jgi:hypothetical protein
LRRAGFLPFWFRLMSLGRQVTQPRAPLSDVRFLSHCASKKESINMSVRVCPIAIINAPIEKVWPFLSELANYTSWLDLQMCSIVPASRAGAGQTICGKNRGMNVSVTVDRIDESKRQIHLTTMIPFGITVHNHITGTPLEDGNCQVSFD